MYQTATAEEKLRLHMYKVYFSHLNDYVCQQFEEYKKAIDISNTPRSNIRGWVFAEDYNEDFITAQERAEGV